MQDKIKTLQIRLILIFILSIILIAGLYNYTIKKQQNEYIKNTTTIYTNAYNTVYNQYKEMSHLVFSGLVQLTNVQDVFANIHKYSSFEQNTTRKDFFKKVNPRYTTLKQKHIKSINFILADNTIFLKMNNPNHFGHKSSKKRHLIRYVQKSHKFIDSYELGRMGEGFKFIYPIIKKDKYLGLIEITFGAEAITSTLMEQYSILANFHIRAKNFNHKLLKTKSQFYTLAPNPEYIYDMRVINELKHYTKKSDFEDIRPPKQTRKKIQKILKNLNKTSIYDKDTKRVYTTIPVYHKLTKDSEAVFILESKHSALSLIDDNYYIILGIIFIAVTLIFFITYQQSINTIEDEQKKIEEQERQRQLLEKSKHASMGEMIGNIAHQWRQPLSIISTASTGVLLYKDLGTLTDKHIEAQMNLINENAQYLSKTIDTFRNFLREDKESKEVVIQERVKTALSIISANVRNHDIRLIEDIESIEIKKFMPVGELPQVIINIINNAQDIILEKAIIDGWIKLSVYEENNICYITIEDNAGGVPQEIIKKIFEPYFTTKHKSKGTGLGLNMSYKIITESLGGELFVHNTSNGAKFTIKLPL
jgi:signal transduction histidine kinase